MAQLSFALSTAGFTGNISAWHPRLSSPETSARLAGIRTRIQGSAQCPRNQPQGRRFVSFLTYTKLPRIVCTQPAMLSNVSKYTNFHAQSFWIIFAYTHVRSIWSYIEVYLLYHYFYYSNANITNRLSQNLNITQSHASIYKNPCSSGGNFTCTCHGFFLVFCRSCRSLFRHVRACAAASRLLIVPARRLSSFETGTMPVCAYFLQFFQFGHSFQCLLLLPSFVCCMFCFFTTLRPSLI